MDPLVRKLLEPRGLAGGAVGGVLIGVVSILLIGSEGDRVAVYVGVALAVVLTAPWILSVLYLRTERGRAARADYLVRRRNEYLATWGDEDLSREDVTDTENPNNEPRCRSSEE